MVLWHQVEDENKCNAYNNFNLTNLILSISSAEDYTANRYFNVSGGDRDKYIILN
jgi:hypothetical protein